MGPLEQSSEISECIFKSNSARASSANHRLPCGAPGCPAQDRMQPLLDENATGRTTGPHQEEQQLLSESLSTTVQSDIGTTPFQKAPNTMNAIHHINISRNRQLYYSLQIGQRLSEVWDLNYSTRIDKLIKAADVDALGSITVQPALAGRSASRLVPRILILCANKAAAEPSLLPISPGPLEAIAS